MLSSIHAFMGPSEHLRLSPLRSHSAVLVESSAFSRALIDPIGPVLASERMVRRSFVSVGRRTS